MSRFCYFSVVNYVGCLSRSVNEEVVMFSVVSYVGCLSRSVN